VSPSIFQRMVSPWAPERRAISSAVGLSGLAGTLNETVEAGGPTVVAVMMYCVIEEPPELGSDNPPLDGTTQLTTMELSLVVNVISEPGIISGARGFGVMDTIVEEGDCPVELIEIILK
jgi:hypothetical protein